jgi:hypothetical protein
MALGPLFSQPYFFLAGWQALPSKNCHGSDLDFVPFWCFRDTTFGKQEKKVPCLWKQLPNLPLHPRLPGALYNVAILKLWFR